MSYTIETFAAKKEDNTNENNTFKSNNDLNNDFVDLVNSAKKIRKATGAVDIIQDPPTSEEKLKDIFPQKERRKSNIGQSTSFIKTANFQVEEELDIEKKYESHKVINDLSQYNDFNNEKDISCNTNKLSKLDIYSNNLSISDYGSTLKQANEIDIITNQTTIVSFKDKLKKYWFLLPIQMIITISLFIITIISNFETTDSTNLSTIIAIIVYLLIHLDKFIGILFLKKILKADLNASSFILTCFEFIIFNISFIFFAVSLLY